MATQNNIHFLSDPQTALTDIARFILDNSPNLPDLSQTQIILNESRLASPFRNTLLQVATENNHIALLGPYFFSLDQWLEQYRPNDVTVCDEQVRLLILVEALIDSPDLLKQANPWTLADSLLLLFDELTLNKVDIAINLEQFSEQLANWYASDKQKTQHYSGLQHEAQLVYQLWHGWHEQLAAQGLSDTGSAHIRSLNKSLQLERPDQQLHLIGIEPTYTTQQHWLIKLLENDRVHLWILGQPSLPRDISRIDDRVYKVADTFSYPLSANQSATPFNQTLAAIFSRTPQLQERALTFAKQHPHSALAGKLSIYRSNSAEQQTHAIDTQIRKWIIEGKQRIAVISENRLMARRLRALLERADVPLYDAAGWTLSTTRAAANIESLLLCIEEDFEKDALLDLLKSGFMKTKDDSKSFKHLIYRLEHDIIQHEQITNNLDRYQQAILNRQDRLKDIWTFSPSHLLELLEDMKTATTKLQGYFNQEVDQEELIGTLIETLDALGLTESFAQDPAGNLILNVLQDMLSAAKKQPFRTSWYQFRAWLARNLENRYFQPSSSTSGVQLFNLAQAEFQHFDAVIVAGLEYESFPGSPPVLTFFNNHVRAQLQLPEIDEFYQQRLRQFNNVLNSANSIVLTYRKEQNGESIHISPWVNAIEQFHTLAYNDDLSADKLNAILSAQNTQVIRCDTKDLPATQQQPTPSIPETLVPKTISASSYQQLINCPYQFFSSYCLKLRPPEEIQQALSKREYGERVHLCLQAFHSDVPQLPGPFTKKITEQSRQQAIELMLTIAAAVFEYDIEENYIHKGWYHQWQNVIPVYINWFIKKKTNTVIKETEQKLKRIINDELTLNGRIDRIDQEDGKFEVIDYKTGTLPNKKDVLNGEQVQLPFYALLADSMLASVESVGYLAVGKDKNFREMFPLKGDELNELAELTLQRLTGIIEEIKQGQGLPAWENTRVCQYCDMTTLCREGTWQS